ncbi:MAG: agmatinase [Myxococcota bacterium]|nr:agmatinase [Myxococcota bacterium]
MSCIEQRFGCSYEGIPSFCRVPICPDLSNLDADVAIAGICLDTGTLYRPGTRFGPKAIREASMIYASALSPEGLYDIDSEKKILSGLKIVDCGDLNTMPTLLDETMDIITVSIETIRESNALPVILGGDHSISFPIVRGFSNFPLHVIQFDTHMDLLDDFVGLKYTHANQMRRIVELEHVHSLTQIGIRGLLNNPNWYDETVKKKSRYFTAEDIDNEGVDSIISKIRNSDNIYLTIDIDCLDPSIAPGTGTPEPGGLSYRQLKRLLQACPTKGRIVGIDLVEVNPLMDQSGRTAQVASRLILDLLGSIFAKDIRREY